VFLVAEVVREFAVEGALDEGLCQLLEQPSSPSMSSGFL
jgi:hypothetical protein